jgi:hypothetical protein
VLAAIGCREWARGAKGRRFLAPTLLLASLPSTLILLAGGVRASLQPGEPVFIPRGAEAAFEWLRGHGQEGDSVVAAFETGNVLRPGPMRGDWPRAGDAAAQ